jgi:hypothetical protein
LAEPVPTRRVVARIEEDLLDWVFAYAKLHGTTVTDIIKNHFMYLKDVDDMARSRLLEMDAADVEQI